MSAEKPTATAPKAVVADDPDDRKGRLKNIGGAQSDRWNNILANQAVQALWLKNSSPEERDKQLSATVAALIGIAPKDELEGMMAAQLVAAHNAAMECYRRAMIRRTDLRGPAREPRPSQQAVAHLRGAARSPQPPSRQGPAEGHGRARPRPCGRASGGRHGRHAAWPTGGWGCQQIRGTTPCTADSHASEPALPRPNPQGDALPVARDDERAMPDARRQGARRGQGQ